MKKFIFGIIVFVVYPISAQTTIEDNSVVRSALDNMFETLDKSRVPTGLLQDYAVDLVGLENYNGTILADALQNAEGAEHTISVVDLTICNSAQEKLQHIPFAIIYKPTFPETE